MLNAAFWILGTTVTSGLVLACLYLQERPIRGWARWTSLGHGGLGIVGAASFFASIAASATDRSGMGRIAMWLLIGTLVAASVVVVTQLRRHRPLGLVVVLHATFGVAGYVFLAAYSSLSQ